MPGPSGIHAECCIRNSDECYLPHQTFAFNDVIWDRLNKIRSYASLRLWCRDRFRQNYRAVTPVTRFAVVVGIWLHISICDSELWQRAESPRLRRLQKVVKRARFCHKSLSSSIIAHKCTIWCSHTRNFIKSDEAAVTHM